MQNLKYLFNPFQMNRTGCSWKIKQPCTVDIHAFTLKHDVQTGYIHKPYSSLSYRYAIYGCFQKKGVPQNGWFIRETPIKMDDLGAPLFLETPI